MILATWYYPILATIFAFMAVVLMGVILLQRGRGVGLAGAFGGVGGHTAFGAKTGDFLTWATIVIASIFLSYVVVLNYVFVPLKAVGSAPPPPVMPEPHPTPAEGAGNQTAPAADGAGERPVLPANEPAGQSQTPRAGEEEAGSPSVPQAGPQEDAAAPQAPGRADD